MSAAEPSSKRAGRFTRALAMLTRPAEVWAEIAAEPASLRDTYLGYVVPLAAIPPVCGAIGLLVFGASIAGIHLKPSLGAIVAGAALDYVTSLAAVGLLALAITGLAPAFGAAASFARGLKLVAYSGTALWVAGVFALYPTLGFPLAVLGGLYSLYALYLGLFELMLPPHDKVLTYYAAVLVSVLALAIGFRLLGGQLG